MFCDPCHKTNIITKQKCSASSTDDLITPTIQQINDHYHELLQLKKKAAKICVISIINATWMSPAQQTLMWIGGLRPSDILILITNHLELSSIQTEKMESLKISTLKKEADISNIMDRLKNNIGSTFIGKCFVDKGDYAAMSNYRNNVFELMEKLTVFQDILNQADALRAFNLKESNAF
ncbi:transcription factor TGA2.1-like [Rutidosis leptorrhynchoides]|uniref:transcription factor TGA2.1-like n=1 Tax=Rutidosis leptorrhynchoides TaxID=125765 RepID=UPI003A991EB3